MYAVREVTQTTDSHYNISSQGQSIPNRVTATMGDMLVQFSPSLQRHACRSYQRCYHYDCNYETRSLTSVVLFKKNSNLLFTVTNAVV